MNTKAEFRHGREKGGKPIKKPVINPEYGMYVLNGRAFASSLDVAHDADKRHDHVLRDIESIHADLLKPVSAENDLPKSGEIGNAAKSGFINFGPEDGRKFFDENFVLSSYKDSRGRKQPMYLMTRGGFSMVALAYSGPVSASDKM